mmetsp:Transcript_78368/g.123452  ORF Transcript_78368/g.123452 Transcript_78368/m.123452 type:complete len:87 (+) Transcript_78368:528-788(+)
MRQRHSASAPTPKSAPSNLKESDEETDFSDLVIPWINFLLDFTTSAMDVFNLGLELFFTPSLEEPLEGTESIETLDKSDVNDEASD